MVLTAKNIKMSENDGIGTACTSANDPNMKTDRIDSSRHGASPSVLSQQQTHKAALSASSAPFVPKNSPSQQQQVGKNSLSASSAPDNPLASAAMPKILPQHQANKKTLSVSTPPFDPSWRQKLKRSPAVTLPDSATASTSMSAYQQDCDSARENAAAMMMPGVHHHPMNTMPPPMSMPGHGMIGIPGQVYNRHLSQQPRSNLSH